MDLTINVFGGFRITDNITFLITETVVNTWIIMGLLLVFAIIVRIKSKKWDPMKKPTGLQNFVEMCVDAWENFLRSNAGNTIGYLAPWFFSLFLFLIISNIIGVTGLRPPTADWGMTFPLAVSSFFFIQYAGLRHRPKEYLKGIFLEPVPIFAPLNIIGELSRPISLSFRLYGNVLGGMVLLSMLYYLPPMIARFILPIPLHLYFDLFAGLLQALIFTMLSVIFVGMNAEA
ncbi:MAG: F0F1 ATP synthase subunit A [Defluviitaleaceae bacterium]|nr:F0F1 ATP synthase subunit A [Defluviitaleaceae bacterium]